MAKSRTIKQQAKAVIRARTGDGNTMPGKYKPVQSIRSQGDIVLALAKIADDLNVKRIKQITPEIANIYLAEKRDNYASQKSLDRDRKALSIALNEVFPRLTAISDQELVSRAYSKEQISLITSGMQEHNALSTKIAHSAGLRSHELITLKRLDEGEKTNSRSWNDDRFAGREGQIYLVTGKGGLVREVLISNDLAIQLESHRLKSPKVKLDRGVKYVQRYDIGGGQSLSQSFSAASKRKLGFSNGFHGVRHKYAQERIDELKLFFKASHSDARDILSQELGHFRGDITEVYLR